MPKSPQLIFDTWTYGPVEESLTLFKAASLAPSLTDPVHERQIERDQTVKAKKEDGMNGQQDRHRAPRRLAEYREEHRYERDTSEEQGNHHEHAFQENRSRSLVFHQLAPFSSRLLDVHDETSSPDLGTRRERPFPFSTAPL